MNSTEVLVILNRLSSNIQSEDRKKRKQALDDLHEEIFEKLNKEDFNADEVFQIIEKNVWVTLYDQSEAVRDSCITLLSKFVNILQPNEKFLGELVPILLWRLGDKEVEEPSEEIRLRLITLLNCVILKYNKCCGAFSEDIVQILSKTLLDNYPKVRQESCKCASNLACTVPFHFYEHSNKLIKPILASFNHQHYRMRVAAIEALGKVVRWGSTKNLPSQEVFGSLAEKLFDTTPNVRSAVTKVIGDWILNLHDRYSFFTKIIPLILTSLCDEMLELREEAWNIWCQAGLQYEQENETDLKDKMDFLYEKPDHYPSNVLRPNLGCRTLVQRNLCQITAALSKELEDWKNDIRIKSAQLLCWLVLHAETDITQHTENLLLTMYKVCNQTDTRIVENVEKAAEYIGYFVSPDIYMKLIVPIIQDSCTSGHLCVLAALIRGTKKDLLRPHITAIGELLSNDDICRIRKVNLYHNRLLQCVDALVMKLGADISDIGSHLFLVIITVKALSQGHLNDIVNEIITNLTEALNKNEVTDLYEMYTELVLDKIDTTADAWTSVSCERFIFQTLLEESGHVIGLHLLRINELLKKTMKPKGDSVITSKFFILMSSILTNRQTRLCLASEEVFRKFIISFIQDIICPNLVWHAGRTAEALRTLVVACLCAALMTQNESMQLFGDSTTVNEISSESTLNFLDAATYSEIFETLFPLLLNSIEDCAVKTRLLSMKALQSLLSVAAINKLLTPDHVNQSYPLVLKRLDDVHNEVRIAAVQYLILLYNNLPYSYNSECFEPHLDSLFSTLLIHLDDPDEKFQKWMTGDALKAVGKIEPKLLHMKLKNAKSRFRNFTLCNELLDNMKALCENASIE